MSAPHLVFGLVDAVGVVVGALEGRDDALLFDRELGLEAEGLVRGAHRVLQLGDGRQQTGAVHAQLAVLPA